MLRWAKLNFSLVLLPALVILTGLYHVNSLQKTGRIRTFETEAAERLESLRYYAATEQYLCTSLAGIFDNNPEPAKLKAAVEKFAVDHELNLQFFINSADGGVHFSNFPLEPFKADLKAAFESMQKFRKKAYPGGEQGIPPDVYANLRLLYGPHFFPRYYHNCFSGKNITLRRGHADAGKPLLWLNFSDTAGLSVFLPHDVLDSYCGVRFHSGKDNGRLITGYISSGQVFCRDPALVLAMREQAGKLQKSLSSIIRVPGYYLLVNYIDSTMTVFCAVRAAEIEALSISSLTAILTLLMLGGFCLIARFSYLAIVGGQSFSMRLQKQLILLFLASNALPGFVVYTIGSDYLQQFRSGLVVDSYNAGMAYLQSVDELYGNEFTVQKGRIENSLDEFRGRLKAKGIVRGAVKKFVDAQTPRPYAFYLVASSTGFVASERGILRDEKLHEAFSPGFKNDKVRINTMKAMYKIGTYVLATLNKQPLSSKAGTEAELVSETLTQRSPTELIRAFADHGSFSEWGLGAKRHPTYVNLLQLFDKAVYDYLLFYLWDSDDLEMSFISRVFHSINRNELGLKVMAVEERFYIGYPEEILTDPRLRNFALKLRDRNVARPENCVFKGEPCLLFGHKCVALANIRLLGLFPLSRIDAQVEDKRRLLSLLAFVSLLISMSVGLFIAGSILQPLNELQAGVVALNERNFAWRVPDLGGDEFGHLAMIFNETLVDLEELHVASQVQEKLITRMPEPQKVGCLQYFCRAGMTSGFSGEYFDRIETDDSNCRLVFGRALDPGVAGSLVLAFVKSATMQLQRLSDNPARFLSSLTELLRKSRENTGITAIQLQSFVLMSDGKVSAAGVNMPRLMLYDLGHKEIRLLESPLELYIEAGQILIAYAGREIAPVSIAERLSISCSDDCGGIYDAVTSGFVAAGADVQALLIVCRV